MGHLNPEYVVFTSSRDDTTKKIKMTLIDFRETIWGAL